MAVFGKNALVRIEPALGQKIRPAVLGELSPVFRRAQQKRNAVIRARDDELCVPGLQPAEGIPAEAGRKQDSVKRRSLALDHLLKPLAQAGGIVVQPEPVQKTGSVQPSSAQTCSSSLRTTSQEMMHVLISSFKAFSSHRFLVFPELYSV